MAGVLVDGFLALGRGGFYSPGFGVDGGIIYRGAVDNSVRTGAGEPLRDVQVLVCEPVVNIAETALVAVRKIGGIDNQCRAFPMATGIALPLTNAGWEMRVAI